MAALQKEEKDIYIVIANHYNKKAIKKYKYRRLCFAKSLCTAGLLALPLEIYKFSPVSPSWSHQFKELGGSTKKSVSMMETDFFVRDHGESFLCRAR